MCPDMLYAYHHTSDWILGYIKENGRTIEFGWVDDVPDDAFDYFVKEIGAEV